MLYDRNMSQPLSSSPSTMVSSFGSPQPSEYMTTPPSTFADSYAMPTPPSLVHQSSDAHLSNKLDAPYSIEPESSNFSDSAIPIAPHLKQNLVYESGQLPAPGPPTSNPYQMQQTAITLPLTEFDPCFALMGDPYFQYSQIPEFYQSPLPGLNQQQQDELMQSLESDSATYGWRFP